MTNRVRLYPYKVTYIEVGDYWSNAGQGKLPVFNKLIRAKSSDEAKAVVKKESYAPVVVLTVNRHPENKGKVIPVRWSVLTPYQLEVVQASLKAPAPVAAAPLPPQPPPPPPVFPIDRPMPSDLAPVAPISVGGFTFGGIDFKATATPATAPDEAVQTITFTSPPPIEFISISFPVNTDDAPAPPVLAVIPYVAEADPPLSDEEKMAAEACEVLNADGYTPDSNEKVDWPVWPDNTGLSPLAPDFFSANESDAGEVTPCSCSECTEEVPPTDDSLVDAARYVTPYGMLDRDLPSLYPPTGENLDPPPTKSFWIAMGVAVLALAGFAGWYFLCHR
jgi:hypothetical protein